MKKDTRKNIKVPQELWKIIKAAAKRNNRKIVDDLREKYKYYEPPQNESI